MPPIPAYRKLVSQMKKRELQALSRHFDLDDDGLVADLRTRLNDYLTTHRNTLQNNPLYTRLYPRRGPRNQLQLPGNNNNNDNNDDDVGDIDINDNNENNIDVGPDNNSDNADDHPDPPNHHRSPSVEGSWHGIGGHNSPPPSEVPSQHDVRHRPNSPAPSTRSSQSNLRVHHQPSAPRAPSFPPSVGEYSHLS